MWEHLACVGEINYSSTFLEGVASIFTRQPKQLQQDPPPHTRHGSADRITQIGYVILMAIKQKSLPNITERDVKDIEKTGIGNGESFSINNISG